ncbi:hypothetical protein [Lentibacillus sp.]|uniref:hypothetical protein n=1 Tax=Lentibacillus sp. TaxID=1925746 RepID=UPI002B4B0FBB|nr:hypothetical protein [Lentibacillus sp.]HLS09618.1 hypothetical protein [Lentibacillus sp.]
MHDNDNMSFEEIFKQNEKRIHYHMLKLGINDPYREFYGESLYAMWMAYKNSGQWKLPMVDPVGVALAKVLFIHARLICQFLKCHVTYFSSSRNVFPRTFAYIL